MRPLPSPRQPPPHLLRRRRLLGLSQRLRLYGVPRKRSLIAARTQPFLTRMFSVNPMIATLPTLAVTAIYYCWHVLYLEKCRRDRVLRERVAYMLWTMALSVEDRAA
jgi:hypothetical protein